MKQYLTILVTLVMAVTTSAQVGINTVDPTETLDVDGSARIRQITKTTPSFAGGDLIIYTKPDGTLQKASFSPGTTSIDTNGDIVINAATSPTYGFAEYELTHNSPGFEYNNMNLSLGVGEANESITVVRLDNTNNRSFDITGIAGGTAGRHILLFNPSGSQMTFVQESPDSSPENRLFVFGNTAPVNGPGIAELVYDGIAERWVLINERQ
jgi:hypothetical protein